MNGAYVEIVPNAKGHLWSEELGLFLGLESNKLRYFYLTGAIVRTSEEDAIQFAADVEEQLQRAEQQRLLAEQESQRAEQQRLLAEHQTARADRLAQQLRSLGIEPDSL